MVGSYGKKEVEAEKSGLRKSQASLTSGTDVLWEESCLKFWGGPGTFCPQQQTCPQDTGDKVRKSSGQSWRAGNMAEAMCVPLQYNTLIYRGFNSCGL